MDQQEWMGYVSRLANGEYPVPVGMTTGAAARL